MELEQAQDIFYDIVDLCYETENSKLIELVNQLHQEVELATDLSAIIRSTEELVVIINEMDFLLEEEDQIQDVRELIEKLSE